MTDPTVAAIVAGTHPERTLVATDPVDSGSRRETVVARFEADPPLVVQTGPDARQFATTALLRRVIRLRTSVPVPPLVATGTHEGTAYLISEHRRGDDPHARFTGLATATRRRVTSEFGRSLGALHDAFAFDGCGRLEPHSGAPPLEDIPAVDRPVGDDWLVAPGDGCGRWVVDYGLSAIDRLPAEFDGVRDRLVDCLDGVAPETAREARLFPWDLRPGNALVDGGEVTAFLDWERPLAAPPAIAVAKVEYLVCDWYVEDPGPLRRAFERGYERTRAIRNATARGPSSSTGKRY